MIKISYILILIRLHKL